MMAATPETAVGPGRDAHTAIASPALSLERSMSQDPTADADEIRWQVNQATPTVRDALRRLPAPPRSANALGAPINDMHTLLEDGG
jgi:hypothetical protein